MRTETVTSPLLSDLPRATEAPTRDVDPDFADSLRLHLTESLDEYDAQVGGRS
jgi:hypothetical protein